MPVTPEVVARIESTLPPMEMTLQRLNDYLSRADMPVTQFAKMAGRSESAIRLFRAGTYVKYNVRTDVLLRRAIEDTLERHPVGAVETEADGALYETENVADLRKWFTHCHERRALAFCYGPPGSQKTFVLKHLVAEFNRRELVRTDAHNRAYFIRCSVRLQPRDFLVKLCIAAGAHVGCSLQRCMTALRNHLVGSNTLFVLDEAQYLSIDCLEALRELHDESPRIGALLAGSHNLKQLFDRRAAELEQWNSRIDAGIELTGVSDDRARLILRVELPSLSEKQIDRFIEGARATDAYSRTTHTYLNVRRLFKNMEAYRDALATQPARKGVAA
jgi:DNA transposition AAA+ family ATPase